MPIYEYVCPDCAKEFECLVLGGDSEVVCPICDGGNVKRLMSACSFKSGGDYSAPKSTSGCSSCSGTHCATCH